MGRLWAERAERRLLEERDKLEKAARCQAAPSETRDVARRRHEFRLSTSRPWPCSPILLQMRITRPPHVMSSWLHAIKHRIESMACRARASSNKIVPCQEEDEAVLPGASRLAS